MGSSQIPEGWELVPEAGQVPEESQVPEGWELVPSTSTKAPESTKAPTEESWGDKLGRFTDDMKKRGGAIADSASDIALPFTDQSLGEFAFGQEPSGRRQMTPHEAAIQMAGQGVGAAMDTVGAAAEALTPDSLGVGQAVQDGVAKAVTALNNTPEGAKFIQAAMSGVEGWKAFEAKYPQLAKSIGSAGNLASVLTPSTGASKAVLGAAGKAVKPLMPSLDGRRDAIVKNMLDGVKNSQGRGDSPVNMLGSTKYDPVDWENKQVEAILQIPGIRPTGSHHKNKDLIDVELKKKQAELDRTLKQSGEVVDVKALQDDLLPIKLPKGTPIPKAKQDRVSAYLDLFGAEGKSFATEADAAMFARIMKEARSHLSKSDGSPASINKARKDFDAQYNVKWNEVGSAKDEAVKYARRVMNEAVDEVVPDAQKLRSEAVSPLIAAKESVSKKAAKQADTAMGRLSDNFNKLNFIPSSILSVAAVASSIWAPWALGLGVAGLGTVKGVKWTNNKFRDELAKAITDSSKLIKSGKLAGKALEQAKADRLLLIDMMKIPQEGDKGAKE